MLISNRCILCGAVLGPAQQVKCGQDCYADLPTRPAGACAFVAVFRNLIPAPVSAVSRVPQAFDSCIAGKIYRYPVDLMIKRLKYQARLDTVHSLSRCLIERIRRECSEPPECLVPTPLHSSRQRSRGFNQAREIARNLAHHLSLPVDDHLVRRHKATAAAV